MQTAMKPLYGLMHTGLQIGPYIIDWNSASLIVPRRLKSTWPLLFADINEGVIDLENDKLIVHKICEKIVEWNTSRWYSRTRDNCQVFVTEMMEHLGLHTSVSKDSPLYLFLEHLRTVGVGEMSFVNTISSKGKRITFKKHKDLDKFVLKLQKWLEKRGETLKDNYPEEWRLLNGFDRAFWLMHSSNAAIGKPQTDLRGNSKCPFGAMEHEEHDVLYK